MKIKLDDVPEQGRVYAGEEPVESLNFEGFDELKACSDVSYELKAVRIPGTLYVNGRLGMDLECRCRRCDERFVAHVEDAGFSCAWELSEDEKRPPRRVDEEADESDAPGGRDMESVDLTRDIREAMILAFPAFPVCQSDCKGLCRWCGENLNRKACDCRPPRDRRWSVLDELDVG